MAEEKKSELDLAREAFASASRQLTEAMRQFPPGKNYDPAEVAHRTDALRVSVEGAKARLEVALAEARDKSTGRTTCLVVVLTCAIMIATVVQARVSWMSYEAAKNTKPVVCSQTAN